MYQEHFGLNQEPFSIAPDPSFLFLSDAHNEALAHLMYGFQHGGFVLITGEVGTGKTTLLRNLLDRTPPDLDVAFILNPRLTVRELLESLCDELGVLYPRGELQTVKQYIDVLNKHLLKTHQAGRSTVVIIDEAQNLSPAVLEQIRLLTNLETNDKKLLRIILLGQPELADMLDRTELRQLAQRITARYHLQPLSRNEVGDYIAHRLARAGGNPGIFTTGAVRALYRLSKGTPRLLNVIADRAMLGAYVENRYQVSPALVRNAAREIFGSARRNRLRYLGAAGTIVVVALAAMIWAYFSRDSADPVPAQASVTMEEPRASFPSRSPSPSLDASPQSSSDRDADVPPIQQTAGRSDSEGTPPASRGEVPPPADLSRPAGPTYAVRRLAYQAVFDAWGSSFDAQGAQIPCDFAPSVGLQCLSRRGGWSEVNALNTPVIIELWDNEQAGPYYGALLSFDGTYYDLRIGERTERITPRDLRDSWFGAYVMLWQTPPDYNGSLREGDNHPSVRWLHERLQELVPNANLGAPSSSFGPDLRDAVVEFQMTEGLLADGIVGPLTWIRLSDRLDLPAPKLRT